MSVFLLGKTKCPLCEKTLNYSHEITILHYIHPKVSESLAKKLGRARVHRECWNNFEHKELYSNAAYDLALHGEYSNLSPVVIFARPQLLITKTSRSEYRLTDFNIMIDIDFFPNEIKELVDFFIKAISKPDLLHQCNYNCGRSIWKTKHSNCQLRVLLFDVNSSKCYQDFIIPPARYSYWLDGLEFIKKNLSEIPSKEAG